MTQRDYALALISITALLSAQERHLRENTQDSAAAFKEIMCEVRDLLQSFTAKNGYDALNRAVAQLNKEDRVLVGWTAVHADLYKHEKKETLADMGAASVRSMLLSVEAL